MRKKWYGRKDGLAERADEEECHVPADGGWSAVGGTVREAGDQ